MPQHENEGQCSFDNAFLNNYSGLRTTAKCTCAVKVCIIILVDSKQPGQNINKQTWGHRPGVRDKSG